MFRWKHYVLEVYKERSFSKAAQNLFISQPSLSARIKKIEEELGTTLFDRSSCPLQLTESGRIYIEAAQEIAQIEQNVENHINSLNTLKTGHISIGDKVSIGAQSGIPSNVKSGSRLMGYKCRTYLPIRRLLSRAAD